jgi:hypothetical protein
MEMGGQRQAPVPLPGTHCTGGWVSLAAGLDGHKKNVALIPRTAQPVASHYTDYAVPFAYNKVLYEIRKFEKWNVETTYDSETYLS